MKKTGINLLKKLSQAHGASGFEHAVRDIFVAELGGNLKTDKSGCVISEETGPGGSPRIMLEAHMDEVGFMVQSITKDGFIKFIPVGGLWSQTLLTQRVRILNHDRHETIGVIGSKPVHFLGKEDRRKVVEIEDMYIDIGAEDKDEVTERFGVNVGDSIVPDSDFIQLKNSQLLIGKAFDNRVGVALAIQATQELRKVGHPNLVSTVGTVQEEVGLRGAETAVDAVAPDAAIILEGSPADDFPGSNVSEQQAIPGKGVQIRFMDASAILNRPFSRLAIEVAEECSIPYQVAVRKSGGTNAKAIQSHGIGVPTIVLGVPTRYIHTPNSIINLEDYLATLRLTIEIIKRLDTSTVESFTSYFG